MRVVSALPVAMEKLPKKISVHGCIVAAFLHGPGFNLHTILEKVPCVCMRKASCWYFKTLLHDMYTKTIFTENDFM